MKKKLKRKIWIFSTSIFLAYITIFTLNPTIWISILPIIIPTGILTVGLPAYAIIKNVKNSLEQKNKEQIVATEELNTENDQNIKIKEKPMNNNIEIHLEQETQFEQNSNQKEKPKMKTKGTIH